MLPKIGERVVIYEDPVTRVVPEGEAVLVQRIRRLPGRYISTNVPDLYRTAVEYTEGSLHLYKVRFDGEDDIRQRSHWSPD
jgi:hypothetical protein